MAKIKLSLGSAVDAHTFDSAFAIFAARKRSDNSPWWRPGALLVADSSGGIHGATVDGDEDDIIDLEHGLRLANNVPIKWTTTGGSRRPMLKLNASDHFVIGSADADSNDQIDMNISGEADVFNIKADGIYADRAAGDTYLRLGSAAATRRAFAIRTAGVARWIFGADNAAESGANAGSDWMLEAYTDAGALIDTPLRIARAAGGFITVNRNILGQATQLLFNTVTTSLSIGGAAAFSLGGAGDHSLGASAGGNTTVSLRGASGSTRVWRISTGNTRRWAWGANATAESGSNVGSDYFLTAYDDAGSIIDSPISVARVAAGELLFVRPIRVNSTNTTADFLSTRATLNFFTAAVTTATMLQAMTSGSIGAITGSTTFRHDVTVGDGAGTNVLNINGGTSSGNESDLIFQAGTASKWYNYLIGASPNTLRWFFAGMTNDSMSLLTDATYAADFRLGYNAAKEVTLRCARSAGSPVTTRMYTGAFSSLRWLEYWCDGTAESGSNAGSNRVLYRYMDDGSTNYHLLTQRRSDGYWFTGTLQKWIVDTQGRLHQPSLDFDTYCYDFDDFLGYNNLATDYLVTVGGLGDAVTRISDSCGSIYLRAANIKIWVDRIAAAAGAGDFKTANYPIIFEARAKAPTTSDLVRFGLVDLVTGFTFTFVKPSAASTTWYATSRQLDADQTNTAITTSSWHRFRIEVTATNVAKYYVDDVLVATLSPTVGTTVLMNPTFRAEKVSAAGGDLYVDYWRCSQVRA